MENTTFGTPIASVLFEMLVVVLLILIIIVVARSIRRADTPHPKRNAPTAWADPQCVGGKQPLINPADWRQTPDEKRRVLHRPVRRFIGGKYAGQIQTLACNRHSFAGVGGLHPAKAGDHTGCFSNPKCYADKPCRNKLCEQYPPSLRNNFFRSISHTSIIPAPESCSRGSFPTSHGREYGNRPAQQSRLDNLHSPRWPKPSSLQMNIRM